MADKGILLFIKKKLEMKISYEEIKKSLSGAGFTEDEIDQSFKEVNRVYKDTHQDLVAANDFLPPLQKKPIARSLRAGHIVLKEVQKKKIIEDSPRPSYIRRILHGTIFEGRLGRRDFMLGFLFFFGLSVVVISFLVTILSLIDDALVEKIYLFIQNDSDGTFLILLPIILTPLTLMILSLGARRLHDIDLPGTFSLVFLAYFIPSSDLFHPFTVVGLYIMATILFIVLLTRRGISHRSVYGNVPQTKGSFFARIFKTM